MGAAHEPEATRSSVAKTSEDQVNGPRDKHTTGNPAVTALNKASSAARAKIYNATFVRHTRALLERIKVHNLPLTAAGVAFFGFLALIPALVAVVSLYGLFGNPASIESTVNHVAGTLPEGAKQLIMDELGRITSTPHNAHTVGFIFATLTSLWAVSSGVGHLIQALNVVYELEESRSFLVRRGQALAFTLSAVVFVVVAIGAISIWPPVVASFGLPSDIAWLVRLAVWPVIAGALAAGLATLYYFGPDRGLRNENTKLHWASVGSAVAVITWLLASVGLQLYTTNFAKYNRTYGSLGAVVLLLTWLWITALVALLGAEINAYRHTFTQAPNGSQKPAESTVVAG